MKEVYIAIRNDNDAGNGSRNDPFNGSTHYSFDALMSDPAKVPANTTVHLGPGIFQTKGFGGVNAGWVLRSGQRIVGSGQHATTLQVVKAASNPGQTAAVAAIWGDRVSGIEICDLTVDANLGRQPKGPDHAQPLIKVDGITLYNATDVRIARVRIMNWGTYTPGGSGRSHECFPIYIAGPAGSGVSRNTVQNCIIEQPAFSQARECTLLNNHAENAGPALICRLLNNVVNGEYTTGSMPLPVEVSSTGEERISYDKESGIVRINTLWPHRLQAGDQVLIAGADDSAWNGRWMVETADDNRSFTLKKAGLKQPPMNSGITAQRYVPPSMPISIAKKSGSTITLTTPRPHWRLPGDYIRVSGIRVDGSEHNVCNGSFRVRRVTADTIQYRTLSAPEGRLDFSRAALDRWPSAPVVVSDLSWRNGIATMRTAVPHYKVPGDYILLAGVYDAHGPDYSAYNGYYKVLSTSNQLELTFALSKRPAPATHVGSLLPQGFQGLSATVGYGGRIEANRVLNVYTGGPYKDSTVGAQTPDKDLTTRDNYYSLVYVGPFTNIQLPPPGAMEDYRQWWNVTSSNIVDLQPIPNGAWNHSLPGGFIYWGPYAQNPAPPLVSRFPSIDTLVAWDNIVRFADDHQGSAPRSGAGFTQFGIYAVSVEHLVVEDNLITFTLSAQPPVAYYAVSYKMGRNNLAADGAELVLASRPKTLPA